jgi:hypothetical protein
MRNWEEVDCPNAHECFNGGHWGKGAYDDEESSRAGGKPWGICWCMTEQEHAEAQEELEDAMKTDCIPLSVESLADALQDSVHKECGGVRAAVSGRPPCNPMATQCPRCNNSVAECDALAGRDTDHDWKFDYCHPHNGEYWYKCVNCGASDWISRADHLSGQLLLLKVGETCKAKDVNRDTDLADDVTKAMRRAWYLGQDYWRLADSESYSDNRQSDEIVRKFEALMKETRDMVLSWSAAMKGKE